MADVEVLTAPSSVAVCVSYLADQFTTRGETSAVGSKVRNPRPAKFVKVRLMGGTRSDKIRYAPMLTFECWADDDLVAFNLGQLTEALIQSMPDLLDACTRVVEVGGLIDQPDPDSGSPRYVFTKQLYLTSTASA